MNVKTIYHTDRAELALENRLLKNMEEILEIKVSSLQERDDKFIVLSALDHIQEIHRI